MTLVFTLLTEDFIVHVSDRRLTDGRTGRQFTTKAAKTVICPPAMIMASFTGLAQIAPPMETGEWLMRTIWANKTHGLFGSLAEAADKAMAVMPVPPALKRQSFLVSGWFQHGNWTIDGPVPPGFRPGPNTTLISNALEPASIGGAPMPFRHATRVLLPNEKFVIDSVGAQVTDQERYALERDVSAAMRSKAGGRERAAALLMAETIRSVGKRDPTVGGGVFIAGLPRCLKPHGPAPGTMEILGVRWGLPEPGVATFIHLPDEPTAMVETPYILGDPFAGIGKVRYKCGPVPSLGPLPPPSVAYDMEVKLMSWYDAAELARRFGGQSR